MKSTITEETHKFKNELIDWRRHFHQYPELGFEEFETSRFVQEKLKEFGIEFKLVAQTGVLGVIYGKSPGPTIALRGDMDALPIVQESDKPYKSKIYGKSHLCGHDAHTSILLGVAKYFSCHPLEHGIIKLLFQPAEEGLAGAKAMIEEGVLENPKVDIVAGLHVHPSAKTGYITVTHDTALASSATFNIEVIGQGGHAAEPHLGVDSIAVSAQLITSLQQIISRRIDPLTPAVLTIGKIQGGFRENVLAPSVRLEGTVRLLDNNMLIPFKNYMESLIKGVCEGFGATYKFDFIEGYPAQINNNDLITLLKSTATTVLGEDRVITAQPSMGADDFAYLSNEVPGVLFRLGTRNEEKETIYPNHHPKFDIDEDALPYGVALLSQFVLDYIKNNNK